MLSPHLKGTVDIHVMLHVINQSVRLAESFIVVFNKSNNVTVPVIFSLSEYVSAHVVKRFWKQLHL